MKMSHHLRQQALLAVAFVFAKFTASAEDWRPLSSSGESANIWTAGSGGDIRHTISSRLDGFSDGFYLTKATPGRTKASEVVTICGAASGLDSYIIQNSHRTNFQLLYALFRYHFHGAS